jgi:hypothetical protein
VQHSVQTSRFWPHASKAGKAKERPAVCDSWAHFAGKIGGNIWSIFWNGGISQILHGRLSTKYQILPTPPLAGLVFQGVQVIFGRYFEAIFRGDIWA